MTDTFKYLLRETFSVVYRTTLPHCYYIDGPSTALLAKKENGK